MHMLSPWIARSLTHTLNNIILSESPESCRLRLKGEAILVKEMDRGDRTRSKACRVFVKEMLNLNLKKSEEEGGKGTHAAAKFFRAEEKLRGGPPRPARARGGSENGAVVRVVRG